jgi:hypothetical protein
MASRMFNRGMYEIINQTTNWTTANIDVLLVDTSYAFDPDQKFVSDIGVGVELVTDNYTRKDLPGPTITEDDPSDSVILDADDITWTALGPATGGPVVAGAIIFRNSGADGSSPLLAFLDFTDTQLNGGDFTVAWSANGIVVSTSP